MKKRFAVPFVAVLMMLPLAGLSHGASVTFFEHYDGQGASFQAMTDSQNSLPSSWNDRISSVFVEEGCMLTIYEHFDFKGRSANLRGEAGGTLHNLKSFNDLMSSYRIIRRASQANPPQAGRSGAVRFYENFDGGGNYFEANRGETPRLDASWNDTVSSVWVGEGVRVTVYEHSDFGGSQRVLTGGRGGTLHNLRDMNDQISSFEIERDGDRREKRRRGSGSGGSQPYAGRSPVVFYEDYNGRGGTLESWEGRENISDDWNDRVSSVWVREGYQVRIYEHFNRKGESRTLSGGDEGMLFNLKDFNDALSSYEVERDSSYSPNSYYPNQSGGLSAHGSECFIETAFGRGLFPAFSGSPHFFKQERRIDRGFR